jgi:CRP/FNR family transcriptional regulator, cyclic AMP receptor protein
MDINADVAEQALFANLDAATLSDIRKMLTRKTFRPGETIFLKHDPAGSCYMIASGYVRLSMMSPEGRELSVRLATTGSMFGEIAALDGGLRTTDATAVTAVETLVLTRTALQNLQTKSPQIQSNIIAMLCNRLRATTTQTESIALHQLEARTAAVLVSLFSSINGKKEGRFTTYTIDLNQRDIAALAGASRPKVNQVLMQWATDGLLKRQKTHWSVDVSALEDIAEAL